MLDSILGTQLTLSVFLACTAASLLLGVGVALVSTFRSRSTPGFAVTLAILPAVVQLVIMLVNGNLGTAREISGVFLSMALGLATGMGYVGLAVVAFVILAAALALLTAVNFGQRSESERVLKITIPESLDYDGLFDDLFDQYTRSHTLERVKTANMGTLYELEYRVTLPGEQPSKEFLDALRCRNGNLNIVCGRPATREAL